MNKRLTLLRPADVAVRPPDVELETSGGRTATSAGRIWRRIAWSATGLILLAGCGGPAAAAPTAIPASVVRPVQPTPAYSARVDVYALLTPGATPQFVTPPAEASELDDPAANLERAAIALYIQNQTPSAMGIAPGGAAIYAERGGRSLAGVPVGGVLTVTGKSADGAWYAVYNDAAVYGWTPAGQLRVYGSDDLVVVEEAPDPAPIATLLAQAAEPVSVLDALMGQMASAATASAATASAATGQPTAAPAETPTAAPAVTPAVTPAETVTPLPAGLLATPTPAVEGGDTAANDDGTAGIISSEGRLNLRTRPDTAAAIVRKLQPGEAVTILQRSEDGLWLQVAAADGSTGWAAAEFVAAE